MWGVSGWVSQHPVHWWESGLRRNLTIVRTTQQKETALDTGEEVCGGDLRGY
jgi:hypothetical protein